MKRNIFDGILNQKTLFVEKEALRHTYQPDALPHRDYERDQLSFNLVEALKGHIPSNMILYGVTGAGKTAVTRYVCDQLQRKGESIGRNVYPVMVNCRQIDTQYRVLSHLGNALLEDYEREEIPFTGWPTDRVFSEVVKRMNERGGVYVLVLDEIDHLVKKAGDDLLYNLTNLNAELKSARACVIGISNDLKFTDFLDPRVRSRLGQQDIVFNPYNAEQLQDILRSRSKIGINKDAVGATDFFGLNYYSHVHLKFQFDKHEFFTNTYPENDIMTDMPYTIYPEGLYRAIRRVKSINKPIIITENGIADSKDDRRGLFIKRYIYAVNKAIEDDIDVRGYFYWSLMDNFEWAEGYDMKFGLYEVDFKTQKRTLRKGSQKFVDIVNG